MQKEDPFAKKEEYRHGFINKAFIKFFSTKMSASLGGVRLQRAVLSGAEVPATSDVEYIRSVLARYSQQVAKLVAHPTTFCLQVKSTKMAMRGLWTYRRKS